MMKQVLLPQTFLFWYYVPLINVIMLKDVMAHSYSYKKVILMNDMYLSERSVTTV